MPDDLNLVDFILHIDVHLEEILKTHGTLIYWIVFAIVFVETGLVIMPFLPGDSLLFAIGALAAKSGLSVPVLMLGLFIAAVLGDFVNYHIGKWLGPPAFSGKYRFLRKGHLEKTQAFFAKHGGKAIIYARFVPIVRTFAPFVAGVGSMSYPRFLAFNVIGALLWVVGFVGAGALFGNIPFVKDNFSKVILGIIVLSVMPIVYEWWKARRTDARTKGEGFTKD
ncbi:MAG: DedA family protein [Planctomycetaceae bacterium]|nr:DedA family protein [Planctomycetaceae bacterium]